MPVTPVSPGEPRDPWRTETHRAQRGDPSCRGVQPLLPTGVLVPWWEFPLPTSERAAGFWQAQVCFPFTLFQNSPWCGSCETPNHTVPPGHWPRALGKLPAEGAAPAAPPRSAPKVPSLLSPFPGTNQPLCSVLGLLLLN